MHVRRGGGCGSLPCLANNCCNGSRSSSRRAQPESCGDVQRVPSDVPREGQPRAGLLQEEVRGREDGQPQLRAVRSAVPLRVGVLPREMREHNVRREELRRLPAPVPEGKLLHVRDVQLRFLERVLSPLSTVLTWRSGARERAYRRRLLEALCRSRGGRILGPRAVKEAADSALALTARGRSRWSRTILFGRRGGKLLVKAPGRVLVRRGRPRILAAPRPEGTRVRASLRTLRWLVPGCRKVSASSLLKEAADYVAALEMQVKAMRALFSV
ncbi:hypothetical protein GW17_00060488 [Ensete ventricosum]|nr:hypothetical protein GW17_00060488 [Ensete ventricosum]